MSLLPVLLFLALLAAPLVALVRGPGWPTAGPNHPDSDRLRTERLAVQARWGEARDGDRTSPARSSKGRAGSHHAARPSSHGRTARLGRPLRRRSA